MKGVAVMKRNILWMIAILLGILLAGCGGQDSTVLDLEAEADGIIRTYSLTTGTRYSSGFSYFKLKSSNSVFIACNP